VLRIYGFNLVLLPVNLAGTISSVVQGITASKAPFARTPKVRNRTVVPAFFVIAPYLLIALAGFTFYVGYRHDRVENMAYAALNVILACYAVKAFIGLRNSVVDVWIHGTSVLYKPRRKRRRLRRKARAAQQAPRPTDWRSVLEVDFIDGEQRPARPNVTTVAAPAAAAQPPAGEPRRRLSFLRVVLVLAVLAGIGYGGLIGVRTRLLAAEPAIRQTWFAPYVDATLTPTFQFQSSSADPAQQTVLGFVVADPGAGCTPSWGGAYTLAQANETLAMGSRIAQVQQDGAQPIVSFGGQAHTSLDVACTSAASLTAAYQSVISAYHLTTIDLDIEGAALSNFQAEERRAAAVANLETAHGKLAVWLTLPVEPSGLQDNAVSVIDSMLRDRVSIAGINVMTMDFAQPPGAGSTMLQSVESALRATHGQLADIFPQYGVHLSSQQIWQRLGATVMIGQNNIKGENFTVSDAHGLVSFAAASHLGRVSMWSLNRDSQCGSSFPENGVVSNTCSGTTQSSLGFSRVFGRLKGGATVTSSAGNVQPAAADTSPADAPYPAWSANADYPLGYKVVEDGEIYEAKWYNTGDDPQAQVQYSWQSPWELLGPVLPGDHAPVMIIKPKAEHYKAWSITAEYHAGSRVLYQGLPYQAKWGNQGVSPQTEMSDPAGSPWKPLYEIPGEPTVSPVPQQ
jgi:chitinase